MTETRKMHGTFAQEEPAPGETWHLLVSDTILEPICGYELRPGRFEVWTTDQMQAFKVCAGCKKEASL